MALKSYRLTSKKKKKKKSVGGIVRDGVTAVLGVALVSETASAVNRI